VLKETVSQYSRTCLDLLPSPVSLRREVSFQFEITSSSLSRRTLPQQSSKIHQSSTGVSSWFKLTAKPQSGFIDRKISKVRIKCVSENFSSSSVDLWRQHELELFNADMHNYVSQSISYNLLQGVVSDASTTPS